MFFLYNSNIISIGGSVNALGKSNKNCSFLQKSEGKKKRKKKKKKKKRARATDSAPERACSSAALERSPGSCTSPVTAEVLGAAANPAAAPAGAALPSSLSLPLPYPASKSIRFAKRDSEVKKKKKKKWQIFDPRKAPLHVSPARDNPPLVLIIFFYYYYYLK
jgi:hypothetical protein